MAFVDEIRITASAGSGGDGVVRWLHEKGKEFGGPSGGNGGKGGDVIFRSVRDLNILSQYRGKSTFRAERGEDGGGKNMSGKSGKHVVIDIPVGSLVVGGRGTSFEILREGEEIVALKGGKGGLGNAMYKSSTHQYPTESTKGDEGETDEFKIELKLIADIGLIGLPNAGKTSLLNSLTNAGAKVGDYPFTTLDPNLGDFHGYVIADIPGLIEGASEGKGLGGKFLRHISRTRLLVHCISCEQDDPRTAYERIRAELGQFSHELLNKREVVVLTKSDITTHDVLSARISIMRDIVPETHTISILDDSSVLAMRTALLKILRSA